MRFRFFSFVELHTLIKVHDLLLGPVLANICSYIFPVDDCIKASYIHIITGLTDLVSLNVSSSRITAGGLNHLKPLKNLRSLTLESCKLNASDIKKLQASDLPNLVSFRPE